MVGSRIIVKLRDKYLEWSNIIDAPVTFGMTLEEFKDYYLKEYGESSLEFLPERLKRVEKNGTSSLLNVSLEDTIKHNRAGYRESHLTENALYKLYCTKRESSVMDDSYDEPNNESNIYHRYRS